MSKNISDYQQLLKAARITQMPENPSKPENAVAHTLNRLLPSKSAAFDIHRIMPLLYHAAMRTENRSHINSETLKHLKNNTLKLIAFDTLQQQWLKKTLDILQSNNVPVILLKSTAFAGTIYPLNAPRLGLDFDFLIKKEHFNKTCYLLGNLMDPVIQDRKRLATHSNLFERGFRPKNCHYPLIEVHRALTNPHLFKIEEDGLWERSHPHLQYNSELIRILSPEDTLLHLAVHAFRDLNFCNHNLLDAHEILCQKQTDPIRLLQLAKEWQATRVVYHLLSNCKDILGTLVEEKLLSNLQPKYHVVTISKWILESFSQERTHRTTLSHRILQLLSQLTFPDNLTRGLRHQFAYVQLRVQDFFAGTSK